MPYKDKIKNKEYHNKYNKEYFKKYPWRKTLKEIKARCNNSKRYSAKWYYDKGIKCNITEPEIKELWFRDKAYLMKKPSIDRIKSDKNYTFDNCQFIELVANIIKSNKEGNIKSIIQKDLEGNFIKKWESIISIERTLGIDHRQICNNLKNKQKSCYGFIWEYNCENS